MSGDRKSINTVELKGRLGRDPEIRSLNSGNRIVKLSLCTEERWKDRQTGEWKGDPQWHTIVSFDDSVCRAADDMRKGDTVQLTGQLTYRKWLDKDGHDHYATEVVVKTWHAEDFRRCERAGDRNQYRQDDRHERGRREQNANALERDHRQSDGRSTARYSNDLDDEVPF